jgi:hypothetical protein
MKRKLRHKNGKILCSRCDTYRLQRSYCVSNLKNKHYICSTCLKAYRKSRLGNINRLIDNIYYHQIHAKNKPEVKYTWEQFSKWLLSNKDFMVRFNTWTHFDNDKQLIPAVMRKNANESFNFDNLLITTARNAREINNSKRQRPVVQMTEDYVQVAEFPNARVAAKILNVKCYADIHECCKGRRHFCKGYRWKYVTDVITI